MAHTATKEKLVGITGNTAVAEAMKQVNPDVCPAYPITPSTAVMEYFSGYVANGEVQTEMVPCESEHSAMSAGVGAAAAGARVMTATSSQGLALMHEMLYIASGMRLPIVLAIVNRALSAPINIHCDHSDAMGSRDSGCIQIYSETVQEAYDNLFQAVRIAEHPDVMLPVMDCQDGFITSHAIEPMSMLDDAVVKEFVGEYKAAHPLLDTDNAVSMGAMTLPDSYMHFKYAQNQAMVRAKKVVVEVGKEFEKISGRPYGLIEEYMLDDAEVAVVVMSSAAGTTKAAVDELRKKGKKVGVLRPRLFRPFPYEEVAAALKGVNTVCVLDRADSMSSMGGPLFGDIRSSLYELDKGPKVVGRIFGLGGRDFKVEDAVSVFDELFEVAGGKDAPLTDYITL